MTTEMPLSPTPSVALRAGEPLPAPRRDLGDADSRHSTMHVSIAGVPATVVDVRGDCVSVHTGQRLCPGRRVNVRIGRAAMTTAAIVSSWVHALRADGPVYAVSLAMAAPAVDALVSGS